MSAEIFYLPIPKELTPDQEEHWESVYLYADRLRLRLRRRRNTMTDTKDEALDRDHTHDWGI